MEKDRPALRTVCADFSTDSSRISNPPFYCQAFFDLFPTTFHLPLHHSCIHHYTASALQTLFLRPDLDSSKSSPLGPVQSHSSVLCASAPPTREQLAKTQVRGWRVVCGGKSLLHRRTTPFLHDGIYVPISNETPRRCFGGSKYLLLGLGFENNALEDSRGRTCVSSRMNLIGTFFFFSSTVTISAQRLLEQKNSLGHRKGWFLCAVLFVNVLEASRVKYEMSAAARGVFTSKIWVFWFCLFFWRGIDRLPERASMKIPRQANEICFVRREPHPALSLSFAPSNLAATFPEGDLFVSAESR